MAKVKKAKPTKTKKETGIFEFVAIDNTGGIINLGLVAMARWDGSPVRTLQIFFLNGPHVSLDEKEGQRFLEAIEEHHAHRVKL